jgi:hypothetical protein
MAPDVINNVSSSVVVAQSTPNFCSTLTTKGLPSNVRSRRNPQAVIWSYNLPPIHDEHRYSGIGQVGHALVTDDGNEFGARMASR